MNAIATIGEIIETNEGIVGKVEAVHKNSVVVLILENPTENEYELNRTVIAHKNYSIVSQTNFTK